MFFGCPILVGRMDKCGSVDLDRRGTLNITGLRSRAAEYTDPPFVRRADKGWAIPGCSYRSPPDAPRFYKVKVAGGIICACARKKQLLAIAAPPANWASFSGFVDGFRLRGRLRTPWGPSSSSKKRCELDMELPSCVPRRPGSRKPFAGKRGGLGVPGQDVWRGGAKAISPTGKGGGVLPRMAEKQTRSAALPRARASQSRHGVAVRLPHLQPATVDPIA